MAISTERDVFAVPGPPYLGMASLANTLIKEGAHLARNAADILAFYGSGREDGNAFASIKQIQLDFLQREIYNLLLQGDTSVESLALSIKYPQSEINSALTLMELGGIIKRLPGGKYGI
jgi:DNA processing protein